MTIYQFLKVLDTLGGMERSCQFNVVCKTNYDRYERYKRFLELTEANSDEKRYNILMDLSIESGVSIQTLYKDIRLMETSILSLWILLISS